jgi:hypothetical protein
VVRGTLPPEILADAISRADVETDLAARLNLDPQWDQETLGNKVNRQNRRRGIAAQFSLRWAFGMPRLEPPWNEGEIFHSRQNGDVGDTEVRSTKHETGKYLLHKKEINRSKMLRNAVLVPMWSTGEFTLPGWLPMPLAVDNWEEFKQGYTPCMGVSQDKLWPIRHLVITEEGVGYRIRMDLLGAAA